jgi:two-component system OmpR family response regulator
MRVLLIEEDSELTVRITDMLADAGYLCDTVDDLASGEYYSDIRNYALILVDWSLVEGKDFLRTVRYSQPNSVIIALSGRDDNDSEITALREGADDYLRKPFDMAVLHARIDARMRRNGVGHLIEIDELIINTDKETLSYQGRNIELRGKPFDVFTHLARHRDQIVSKEQLLDALWVEPELVTPNVIDVAVTQIRQKIDKRLGITTIETVQRRGYRFCYPQSPVRVI